MVSSGTTTLFLRGRTGRISTDSPVNQVPVLTIQLRSIDGMLELMHWMHQFLIIELRKADSGNFEAKSSHIICLKRNIRNENNIKQEIRFLAQIIRRRSSASSMDAKNAIFIQTEI